MIGVRAMPCECGYYDNAVMRERKHWWKSGGAERLGQSGGGLAVGRETGAERLRHYVGAEKLGQSGGGLAVGRETGAERLEQSSEVERLWQSGGAEGLGQIGGT